MNARRAACAGALSVAVLATAIGCGKKGPPLPPLAGSVPRIADLSVEQVGDEARATFTLPVRPEADQVDYVTTAVELWRRASETGASAGADLEEKAGVGAFTERAKLVAEARGPELFDVLARPQPYLSDEAPGTDGAAVHEYALVLRTNLRKRGTLSNVVSLEVIAPPPPPLDFRAEALETGILVTWTAPGAPSGEAPPPAEEGAEPAAGATEYGYFVYRAVGERPFPTEPLNENAVRQPQWADADVAEGVRYRYRVRTVLPSGDRQVLSGASEVLSVDYRDSFPPAVPDGLRLIPDGPRAVNIIWNPNGERDLAGYGIYRRSGEGEWTRLDRGNVRKASFVDRAVLPGESYDYAVTAFDGSDPPNESERTDARSVSLPAEP